ncbi:hypothetical protein GOBAR_DD35877 [Gossypium barbadense]|nr:hypothetical protein GOBAR_DD35877 [Gossypium barbadense]
MRFGLANKGLELLDEMRSSGILPNRVVYNTLISSFYKEANMQAAASNVLPTLSLLVEAQLVLKDMVDKGVEPNIYSYNIVMDGLCKNGMLSDVIMVMGFIVRSGLSPDTVTYSTLLHGYCRKGKLFEANAILNEMMRNGCVPNTYTCNILLHSLWKEGKILEAEKLLQKMNEKGYGVDTVTCNIVIDGLCKSGKLDKAMEIAHEMWTHGSAALGKIYEAKKKFREMMGKNLQPNAVIFDTFIHIFRKEGKISSAFRVLKDMEKNDVIRAYRLIIH